MKKIIFTLPIIVAIFVGMLALAVFAQESSPQWPHLFYGTAKVNNADLPTGSIIITKVSNVEKGRITTTSAGSYGGPSASDDKLLVQGDIQEGATIEFFVSTIKANEVAQFKSGEIENKDLTWNFPSTIEFNEELANEPYTCMPGTDIEINLDGLTITIECDTASAGTINNISIIDTPTSGAISVFPGSSISSFYEISISGDVDIIVTITYDDTGIDESTVKPYKFDGSSWVHVPDADIISRDTSANTITFRISPGTPYTLFGSSPTVPTTGTTGGGGGGGGPTGVTGLPSEEPTPPEVPTPPGEVTPTGEVTGEEPTPAGEEAEGGGLLGITGRAIQNLIGGNPIIATLVILFVIVLGVVFYYRIFRRRKKEEGYL